VNRLRGDKFREHCPSREADLGFLPDLMGGGAVIWGWIEEQRITQIQNEDRLLISCDEGYQSCAKSEILGKGIEDCEF